MRVYVELEIEIPTLTTEPTIEEVDAFVGFELGYYGSFLATNPFYTAQTGKTKDGIGYKFDVENFDCRIVDEN